MPRVAFVCVLVLLGRTVEPVVAQQQPSLEQLRDAAGNYARAAFPRLANLVATEKYEQRLREAEAEDRRQGGPGSSGPDGATPGR